jgi:hypothetical protein
MLPHGAKLEIEYIEGKEEKTRRFVTFDECPELIPLSHRGLASLADGGASGCAMALMAASRR